MYPVLFTSFGIPFYSYGVFLGLAIGLGLELTATLFKKYSNLTEKRIYLLLVFLIISAWAGAKLFFLFFSMESGESMARSSFWMGGGFVFYGSLVTVVLVSFFLIKVFKLISLDDCGLFVPGTAFCHGIGRVGCFLAGCCHGHSEYTIFFKVHPVQLYESFLLIVLGTVFLKKIKKAGGAKGILFQYLISYSVIRFVMEFFRGDIIRGSYSIFSTSQWISLIIFFGLVIKIKFSGLRIRG